MRPSLTFIIEPEHVLAGGINEFDGINFSYQTEVDELNEAEMMGTYS
jgi:hypothetical protein